MKTQIPPYDQVNVHMDATPVPHGWDLKAEVRALCRQWPDGEELGVLDAARLVWRFLTIMLLRRGVSLPVETEDFPEARWVDPPKEEDDEG